jgi:aryl-alcohol dehydrogenase-like predicted oxidoreductase
MARAKGCTPSQFALAWVLGQGEDIVPIPGTKRIKYLEDNAGAARVTLTTEELKRIDAILPPGAASGTRYPEAGMAALNH